MSLTLQATLSLLLDHLSLVASFSSSNRMTHQNLAVCFGPVLLTPTQEAWRAGGGRGGGKGLGQGEEIASAVDFKRHIEALHYLLQMWPGETTPPSLIINVTLETTLPLTVCPLPQCQPIESQQTPTSPCVPPASVLGSLPLIPCSILRCDWLCPRTQRRRQWCPVVIEVVWPGWRAPRQSIGTPETGASVDEIFCRDRKQIMMRWQEARVTEVNTGWLSIPIF